MRVHPPVVNAVLTSAAINPPSTKALKMRYILLITTLLLLGPGTDCYAQLIPAGHWPLTADARDISGNDRHGEVENVDFTGTNGAVFNGRNGKITIDNPLNLFQGNFSINVDIYTADELTDVIGDILSCFNPSTRQGVNFSIMNYAGITNAQSNWRNIHFGITDCHQTPKWEDCGRPGNSMYVRSLTVFDGSLYASTWEPEEGGQGHIYKYGGGQKWFDVGAPDPANCISTLAVYAGELYAGSELYSGGGSSLPLSPNQKHGGVVYRYEGGKRWTSMGKVADVRSVSGLAVYNGKLYAGTGSTGAWRDTPRHRGMYRFDGPGHWTDCGCPDMRIVHLGVHNDKLYGLSYDDGGFFEYLGGTNWKQLGPIPETTQAYAMIVYQGKTQVATWPTGSVYELAGPQQWIHRGRLGEEKEVMGLSVYNGSFYAGTLPLANVYRYDGNSKWTNTGQLDKTPDVKYRRAWSMAVYDGKLFCGVLPSGRVHSLSVGQNVTYDKALSAGWHNLTVTRTQGGVIKLYVDGKHIATSTNNAIDDEVGDLSTGTPLYVGYGQHDYFNGKMRNLRIYTDVLTDPQIRRLSK